MPASKKKETAVPVKKSAKRSVKVITDDAFAAIAEPINADEVKTKPRRTSTVKKADRSAADLKNISPKSVAAATPKTIRTKSTKAEIVPDPVIKAASAKTSRTKKTAVSADAKTAAAKKTAKKVSNKTEIDVNSDGPFAEIAGSITIKADTSKKTVKKTAEKVKAVKKTEKPAKNTKPATKAGSQKEKAEVKATAKIAEKKPKTVRAAKKPVKIEIAEIAEEAPKTKVELIEEIVESPLFKALYDPELPKLDRENRGRLLMQTPTRLYFYWSIKKDPFEMLRSAFGKETGNYTLVLRLLDRSSGKEELHPVGAAGNWWFNVGPEGEYQAEIGFYSVSRPYIRILYSNVVSTPRRRPSPHLADDAEWRVSANKFAEVLDASGFVRDAYEVAIAGDMPQAAADIAVAAFDSFLGSESDGYDGISADDLRHALLAIASGARLEELKFAVSAALFALLEANADKLSTENALAALNDHFFFDEEEIIFDEASSEVFGASRLNFPRSLRSRRGVPRRDSRYNPLSSYSIGR